MTRAPEQAQEVPAHSSLASEFELTEAQREMWLAAMMSDEAARSYNITLLLRLEGPLHREALGRALQTLVDRHDSLRAEFDLKDPVQRIQAALTLRLAFSDLSGVPTSQRDGELNNLARMQTEKSFDLSSAPLLRTHLVRLGERHHVLVLTYSHLIVDGWSGGVLLHELKTLYGAYVQGRSHGLEPALQFAEYSEVLRSKTYQAAASRAEDYWRQQFSTLPAEMDLPSDRLPSAQRSFRAARISVRWEPEFCQVLKKASARQGATLLNFLLAGFKVLLHRINGQEDLVVGMPLAGQISPFLESIPGSRALVGHCVNVLPVRSQCQDHLRFADYLKVLKGTMLDAYEHQELTFGRLLQLLKISRDSGRLPLVPVIFNLDRAVSGFELRDLEVQIQELSRSTLVFDVSINVIDNDRELRLDCDFNTDLFDPTTMERWLGHFRTLLTAAAAEPSMTVAELPLLSQAERHQILTDWNNNALSIQPRAGLHTFFEEQAAARPESIAVAGSGRRLTYRQLNEKANQLAQLLRRHGSGPDVPVGLYVNRSIDLVVAMLAILKSGGSYVALDPVYPPDRVSYILAEAKAPLVVTERTLCSQLPSDLAATIIVIDEVNLEMESGENCLSGVHADNLAYCLFTSGSTGRPKGVALEHRSAIAFVEWARTIYNESELEGVLFSTSVCFDLSVFEVFVPLSLGGKVIVAENALHLPTLAEAAEVTLINSVPSVITELLEVGGIPRSVAVINLAGEPLAQTTVDALYRLPQVQKVYDLYGPTEATTYSTFTLRTERSVATIGRPIANTQAYVLDRQLSPVPIGVAGELYLAGAGLARGYLHRPDLTAERFIDNPFSDSDGRLYRTGDLVRYLPDGRLQYLGRLDHQVKIRGFRIELGEIEASLSRIDGIARAIVVAREDTRGDKRLVAYIVPKVWRTRHSKGDQSDGIPISPTEATRRGGEEPSSSAPNAATLRASLRSNLPEYMIPSAFVFLEAFPLTPNGKVDRKALPEPDYASDLAQSYEAPRGQIEEKLAGILSSILNVPRVGREDSFFDLGGHSILAVTLFNEIDRVFGKRLPLSTLFRAPTIEGLAAALETPHDRSNEWPSLVPIYPQGSRARFFCVHGAGGNVLLYRHLARHLGEDHPFYGLQAQGLDGKAALLTTVEAMAEKYLREIRELQPEGPYCLGGYCLGGTIAYEMAQLLRRDGHDVAFVALFDTYNFTRMERPRLFSYLWQKIGFHYGNVMRLPLSDWPGYFSHKLRVARDGELSSLWKALTSVFRSQETPRDSQSTEASLQDVNDRAAEAYRPEPYAGRVTVFKPRVNYDFYPDPQMGWGEVVTGGLDIVELPVNPHAMLVEPYVQTLASQLREKMEQAIAVREISQSHRRKMHLAVNGIVS